MAVHRGAHEDELQVRPPHHHVFQDGQQEVRLDAALVNLEEREGFTLPAGEAFKMEDGRGPPTSSTMMWVREPRCRSCCSFLSRTPVVQ